MLFKNVTPFHFICQVVKIQILSNNLLSRVASGRVGPVYDISLRAADTRAYSCSHVLPLSKPHRKTHSLSMAASLSSISALRIKLHRHSFNPRIISSSASSNPQQFFIISPRLPPKRRFIRPFSLKLSRSFSINSIFNDDKKNSNPSFHHFLAQAQATALTASDATETE